MIEKWFWVTGWVNDKNDAYVILLEDRDGLLLY